jgi:hypothetical protein
MGNHKNSLIVAILATAIVIEIAILAHVYNENVTLDESGVWTFGWLDGTLLALASWLVTIGTAFVFVLLAVQGRLRPMLGLALLAMLVELAFGKILPNPQGRWDYALVALGTVVLVIVAMLVSETAVFENVRTRLRPLWHSPS